MEYLRNFIKKFIEFSDDDWQKVRSLFTEKEIKQNHLYLAQGKPCELLGFVVEGAFVQFRTEDADRYAFDFSFKDDYIVDYPSFLSGKPAEISIEAMKDSLVIDITKTNLDQVYRLSPVFSEFGRKMVERAFVFDNERIQGLLYKTAEERYINLLENNRDLLAEIPLNQLASYLGVRPETLSRIRARMSKNKHS